MTVKALVSPVLFYKTFKNQILNLFSLTLFVSIYFQAEIGRLVSALRVNLGARPRPLKNIMGYRAGEILTLVKLEC